jgi:hypothetical protein
VLFCEKIRYVGIGVPDCRIADLTISALDEAGLPVDTVVWLRNGGGKTVLLGLFFAHLLPGAREFLKGRKENARFSDHVLDGNTSYVAARWVGEPTRLPLGDAWGDGRPRLVTVRVAERKPGFTGTTLPDQFFSFRPLPGVLDLDTLPVRRGSSQLDLAGFSAEMQRLGREHPELDMAPFEVDKAWMTSLRSRGLDPEVFRYQLQMNAGEGEAATGFMQFKSSDEFVDFLIGVVTPTEALDAIEEEVRRFAGKLRRLPDFECELQLIERALPALRAHSADLGTMTDLERQREAARVDAGRLRAALRGAIDQAGAEEEKAAGAVRDLEREGGLVREERERILAQLTEVEYHLAVFSEQAAAVQLEEAAARLRSAKGLVASWKAAEPVARRNDLRVQSEEIGRLLDGRAREAEPERRAVERAGFALRRGVTQVAEVADVAAERGTARSQELREEAERERAGAEEQVRRSTALEKDLEAARKAVDSLDRERRRLRTAGYLDHEDVASAAVLRWEAKLEAATRRLGEIRERTKGLVEERGDKQRRSDQTIQQVADREADLRRVQDAVARIEAERRAIWDDPALAAIVETPEPDLWAESGALTRRLEERRQELGVAIVRTELEASGDRRARAALEKRGTLPPALDVERALDILQAAGIDTVYAGWDYLRERPDGAARILLTAPELAGGLLLNDPSALEAVCRALEVSGVRPAGIVAIGLAEALEAPANGHRTLWPPHPGLYDEEAAGLEGRLIEERLSLTEETLASLGEQLTGVGGLQLRLSAFLDGHSPGVLEGHAARISELKQGLEELASQRKSLEARLGAIDQDLRCLDDEREQLEDTARRTPLLLAELRSLAVQEESETGWRAAIADGPRMLRALSDRREKHLKVRTELERRAREQDEHATEGRASARQLRSEAASLPDAAEPERGLDQHTVEELRRVHYMRQQAYQLKLGSDVLADQQRRIQEELTAAQRRLAAVPETVQAEALALLGTPDGADETARRDALDRAEHVREAAGLQVQELDNELERVRRRRGNAEDQRRPHAPTMIVSGPESGLRMREDLLDQDLDAQSRENSLNRRRPVENERRTRADRRRLGLDAARNLLAGRADLEDADETPHFPGGVDEAREEATHLVETLTRLDRELEDARKRAERSGDALRRLAGDREFERLGPRITSRVAEPGPRPADVDDLAAQLELRLPGLRADIASAEDDRTMVVGNLVKSVRQAFRDLRSIERASHLPDGLGEWSGQPFVHVLFEQPRSDEEWARRLGGVLDDWIDRERIPARSGIAILRQALRAANTRRAGIRSQESSAAPSAFTVTLLKPDAILTRQRYPVEEMKFSEGQDLTTAILLYCTFVNLRVERGGDPGGAAGALFLDNPIGKASLEQLIELQRKVAARMRVQLIATTGVKDREAISHYPKVVGIRPVRARDARTRYLVETDDPMAGGLSAANLITRQQP